MLLPPGLGGARYFEHVAEADYYSFIVHRGGSDRSAAIVAGTKEVEIQ